MADATNGAAGRPRKRGPVERLQKVLARAGVASRRAAEHLIVDGRVRVNGHLVKELGVKVDPRRDRVEVDGRRVVAEKPAYYVLHKPRGFVTTLADPEGRPTIRDLLAKIPERVFPVGRLDFNTSGVLLLTNDGALSEALLRPKQGVEKIYVVKMSGHLTEAEFERLRTGVELDDGHVTKPAVVQQIRFEERTTWVQITLTEGKNRQIHRMGEAIGHRAMRIARTSFAGITAEGLRPGDFRSLSARELEKLKKG